MACRVERKCKLSLAVGLTVILILSIGLMLLGTQTASATFPRASEEIAFASDRPYGDLEIYVMNTDGSRQRQLTSNRANDFWPAWSPNGKQIAFASTLDGDSEIYVMNFYGSGLLRLTSNNEAIDRDPAWSPNGKQIAFVSDRDGDYEIYVMNTDGSRQRQLTFNTADDSSPTWSPDGSNIAFTSNRDGDLEIYRMKADGSRQRQLTFNTHTDWHPAWSPSALKLYGRTLGFQIAFVSDFDGDFDIYVMNTDGSNVAQLTENTAGDTCPAWSPSASKIAFVSDRDGDDEIFVVDTDGYGFGYGTTQLTFNDALDTEPDWYSIWFSPPEKARAAIFQVHLEVRPRYSPMRLCLALTNPT